MGNVIPVSRESCELSFQRIDLAKVGDGLVPREGISSFMISPVWFLSSFDDLVAYGITYEIR
jgi:hypothetical protein